MQVIAKEGQLFVAGKVIKIEERTPTLVSVAVVTRRAPRDSEEKDEIMNLAFTTPQNGQGQDLAKFAREVLKTQAFIAALVNQRDAGEGRKNNYVVRVDLGPSYQKKSDAA